MDRLRWFISITVVALWVGLLPTYEASAHDSGLSTAEVIIADGKIVIQFTFTRREFEKIVRIDADGDGRVSAAEFTTARPALQTMTSAAIEVRIDGQPLAAEAVDAELSQSGELFLRLVFLRKAGVRLSVNSPVIARLARGHRQYVTVQNEKGLVCARILSAQQPSFDLVL